MLEKITIRGQIMGTFIIFALIIVSVITSLALVNLSNISQNADEIASTSLEEQFIDDLSMVSIENSQVIQRKLLQAQAVINSLTTALEQLFSETSIFSNTTSYFDFEEAFIPDFSFYPRLNRNVSLSTSSYYFPFSFPNNVSILTTSAMNDTISRSSHLDLLFQSLYLDSGEFAWLNVEFEEGNILRRYPGSIVDQTREFNHSNSALYQRVKRIANANNSRIEYSAPYFESLTGEWMIKLSKAIFDSNNQFIGTITGDLFLKSLHIETETTYKVTNSSYAILMFKDRNIISHPEWNESSGELKNICKVEINSDGSCAFTELMLAFIRTKENGTLHYLRNGKPYILAYTSILNEFNLLLVIPQSEALEFIEDFRNENNGLNFQISAILAILGIFNLILSIIVGLWLSNRITRPINKLRYVAQQITEKITEKDALKDVNVEDSGDQVDEIGALTRSFNKMIESLKVNKKD